MSSELRKCAPGELARKRPRGELGEVVVQRDAQRRLEGVVKTGSAADLPRPSALDRVFFLGVFSETRRDGEVDDLRRGKTHT